MSVGGSLLELGILTVSGSLSCYGILGPNRLADILWNSTGDWLAVRLWHSLAQWLAVNLWYPINLLARCSILVPYPAYWLAILSWHHTG